MKSETRKIKEQVNINPFCFRNPLKGEKSSLHVLNYVFTLNKEHKNNILFEKNFSFRFIKECFIFQSIFLNLCRIRKKKKPLKFKGEFYRSIKNAKCFKLHALNVN